MLKNTQLNFLNLHPKRLFLIDGCGAIFSALMLGLVWVRLQEYFGIPTATLYFLASFPVLFAMFDFYCWFRLRQGFAPYLKVIGFANLSYCGISLGALLYHWERLTVWSMSYLFAEIVVILLLVRLELSVAKAYTK